MYEKRESDGFSHQVREVIMDMLNKLLPVTLKGVKLVNIADYLNQTLHIWFSSCLKIKMR